MAAPDDGGPAFPVPGPTELPSNGIITASYAGMSLRDYFAAQVLANSAVLDPRASGPQTNYEDMRVGAEYVAEWAYVIADEMLKEREKWK